MAMGTPNIEHIFRDCVFKNFNFELSNYRNQVIIFENCIIDSLFFIPDGVKCTHSILFYNCYINVNNSPIAVLADITVNFVQCLIHFDSSTPLFTVPISADDNANLSPYNTLLRFQQTDLELTYSQDPEKLETFLWNDHIDKEEILAIGYGNTPPRLNGGYKETRHAIIS